MGWSDLAEQFLRLFSRLLRIFQTDLSPTHVRCTEIVVRFLVRSKDFAATKGRVKYTALMPLFNDESNRLETSIHRIDRLNTPESWQLGYDFVEKPDRIIKARGVMPARKLPKSSGLSLDVNGDPFPRHVDIIGWPPLDTAKDDAMQLATEIADEMSLELDQRSSR